MGSIPLSDALDQSCDVNEHGIKSKGCGKPSWVEVYHAINRVNRGRQDREKLLEFRRGRIGHVHHVLVVHRKVLRNQEAARILEVHPIDHGNRAVGSRREWLRAGLDERGLLEAEDEDTPGVRAGILESVDATQSLRQRDALRLKIDLVVFSGRAQRRKAQRLIERGEHVPTLPTSRSGGHRAQ